jgi:hypothetical protein
MSTRNLQMHVQNRRIIRGDEDDDYSLLVSSGVVKSRPADGNVISKKVILTWSILPPFPSLAAMWFLPTSKQDQTAKTGPREKPAIIISDWSVR